MLEAIAYLSIPRSFRGLRDDVLIRWGGEMFRIEGTVAGDVTEHRIKITLQPHRKRIEIDSHPIRSYRDLFSAFVTLISAQQDHELIDGAPQFRRKKFDKFISLFSHGYFDILLSYRNVLEQKNFILKNEPDDKIIRIMNLKLAELGNRLIEMRKDFVARLSKKFPVIAEELIGKPAGLTYKPSVERLDEEGLKRVLPDEIRRGFSLIGPHRDDFLFEFDGHPASDVASEGEKRLMILSLILAVKELWEEEKHEAPVLLLDEPLSLLGDEKINKVMALLSGQTIITAIRPPEWADNIIELG